MWLNRAGNIRGVRYECASQSGGNQTAAGGAEYLEHSLHLFFPPPSACLGTDTSLPVFIFSLFGRGRRHAEQHAVCFSRWL